MIQTPATNPTNISYPASSGNFTLTWLTDHTGWRLQIQADALSVGRGANWFGVPGSTSTNSVVQPMGLHAGGGFLPADSPLSK